MMETRLRNNMVELLAMFKTNEKKHLEKFQKVLQSLVAATTKQQQEKAKRTVHFLGICYCRSSIYTENFEVKLDFYDRDFYLDEVESSAYWNPEFITSYLVKDMEYFEKNIHQYVPRVRTYELQQYLIGYMNNYMYILEEFLRQRMPEILRRISFEELQVDEKIVVFFGEYMGRCKVLQELDTGMEAGKEI